LVGPFLNSARTADQAARGGRIRPASMSSRMMSAEEKRSKLLALARTALDRL
jgi:hypothetical protein